MFRIVAFWLVAIVAVVLIILVAACSESGPQPTPTKTVAQICDVGRGFVDDTRGLECLTWYQYQMLEEIRDLLEDIERHERNR